MVWVQFISGYLFVGTFAVWAHWEAIFSLSEEDEKHLRKIERRYGKEESEKIMRSARGFQMARVCLSWPLLLLVQVLIWLIEGGRWTVKQIKRLSNAYE